MEVQQQIEAYLNSLPDGKRTELYRLHQAICAVQPSAELWFLDGKNEQGKVVSNPNIGYGTLTMRYADGSSRPFYRVGISANTSGISVYIMGLDDKEYLQTVYAPSIGKATVTGYCIKFRKLADVDWDVLLSAIQFGLERKID